jgi:DNA-binding winged helix-turn-helix (wHTH) protein
VDPRNHLARLRFDSFELDIRTGELRKNGRRVRLQDQPSRLLVLLAGRAGELVTRAEIQEALWRDGEFVEFEHAINTAIRKIREALNDDPERPRLIETLPRKGYRFIAPIEEVAGEVAGKAAVSTDEPFPEAEKPAEPAAPVSGGFALPRDVALVLFLMIQGGYLLAYCAALYWVSDLDAALAAAGFEPVWLTMPIAIVTAMCGIAVRLYLLASVGLGHPDAGSKFRKLFPYLLLFDALWAASPLLAARAIGTGLALAGVAGMAYLPFSQRTLIRSIYREK